MRDNELAVSAKLSALTKAEVRNDSLDDLRLKAIKPKQGMDKATSTDYHIKTEIIERANTEARTAEEMQSMTSELDRLDEDIPLIDLAVKGIRFREKLPDGWYLSITPSEFVEIYGGTAAEDLLPLFHSDPTSDDELMEEYLPSKLWRLNNLYYIIDKHGFKTQFTMNYAQHVVYAASLRHPRIIILKSRQQGISTFWLISYEDDAIFNEDLNIGMMAQGLEEAGTLLSRSKLAWDNFQPELKERFGLSLTSDNTKQMGFSNGSTIFIRTSFRSATLQRLHVSELGKIASRDPQKARELKTGTLQAIAAGHTVVIESTAEGSNNMFSIMWDEAVNFVGENRPPKAFYPVFLSWTRDPDCWLDLEQRIDKDAQAYFDKVETELGIELEPQQKWFWVQQRAELGDDIGQEYPATPAEAFAAVRNGTYYATMYRKLVVDNNRFTSVPRDPFLPTYAAMDLGLDDDTVIIFFQVYGKEWRIIDEYHNSGEALLHYAKVIDAMPYRVKAIFLPHDSKARSYHTRLSTYGILQKLGMPVRLLKKEDISAGIELVRIALQNLWVDDKLKYVQDTFLNYTKKWDEANQKWSSTPRHDVWSDPADAIRYMCMSGVGELKTDFEKNYLSYSSGDDDTDPNDFPAPSLENQYGQVIVDGLAL